MWPIVLRVAGVLKQDRAGCLKVRVTGAWCLAWPGYAGGRVPSLPKGSNCQECSQFELVAWRFHSRQETTVSESRGFSRKPWFIKSHHSDSKTGDSDFPIDKQRVSGNPNTHQKHAFGTRKLTRIFRPGHHQTGSHPQLCVSMAWTLAGLLGSLFHPPRWIARL